MHKTLWIGGTVVFLWSVPIALVGLIVWALSGFWWICWVGLAGAALGFASFLVGYTILQLRMRRAVHLFTEWRARNELEHAAGTCSPPFPESPEG